MSAFISALNLEFALQLELVSKKLLQNITQHFVIRFESPAALWCGNYSPNTEMPCFFLLFFLIHTEHLIPRRNHNDCYYI